MAKFNKLSIFTPAYNMVQVVIEEVGKMNRKYRFTVGSNLYKYSDSVVKMLPKINHMNNKLEGIQKLLLACDSVECDVMICRDMKIISKDKINTISSYLTEIVEQATKWKKYYMSKITEENKNKDNKDCTEINASDTK